MSGGHFNHNSYIYYRVHEFADELENEILNNKRTDEWGYAPDYSQETLDVLREQVPLINKVARLMKAIDYLYSGDYGEDSFLEAVNSINNEKSSMSL